MSSNLISSVREAEGSAEAARGDKRDLAARWRREEDEEDEREEEERGGRRKGGEMRGERRRKGDDVELMLGQSRALNDRLNIQDGFLSIYFCFWV